MIVLFNLGSLILGLVAWMLPVVNLMRHRKHDQRNWVALSMVSIGACATSVCFQIFKIKYRVNMADWSALLDTMSAVAFFSAGLLIITLLLNVITLIEYRGKTVKQDSKFQFESPM